MTNTLKKLENKKICFAIMISKYRLFEFEDISYCIVVTRKDVVSFLGTNDVNKIIKAGFESIAKERRTSDDCRYRICEKDMNKVEIEYFKNNISKFNLAVDGRYGKLYEQKDRPFKAHYESSKYENEEETTNKKKGSGRPRTKSGCRQAPNKKRVSPGSLN